MAKHNMTPLGVAYPDIAKWLIHECDALLPCHSPKKVWWWCEKVQGHKWEASIRNRTQLDSGCLVCTNQRVQVGFNDAWTTEPGLCSELKNPEDGYVYASGSHRVVWWSCELGHEWEASFRHRSAGRGCAVCRNKRVELGFNDLWTTRPDLAAELDNPLVGYQVTVSSGVRALFNCREGREHQWTARVADRSRGRGCPYCAHYGFHHDSEEAVLYLVSPPEGDLIFGKVSSMQLLAHAMQFDYGDCDLLALTVPAPASKVSDAERSLIKLPGRPKGARPRAINESLDRSSESVELWRSIAVSHGLVLGVL